MHECFQCREQRAADIANELQAAGEAKAAAAASSLATTSRRVDAAIHGQDYHGRRAPSLLHHDLRVPQEPAVLPRLGMRLPAEALRSSLKAPDLDACSQPGCSSVGSQLFRQEEEHAGQLPALALLGEHQSRIERVGVGLCVCVRVFVSVSATVPLSFLL